MNAAKEPEGIPGKVPRPPSEHTDPATGITTVSKRTDTEIRMTAAQRAERAARLRIQRYTWKDIAEETGYSSGANAYRAVQKYIERIPREAVSELRTMELESLDEAERALLTAVLRGDPTSIATALKIKEQRAKLTGLYDTASATPDLTLVKVQLATEMARLIKAHPDTPIDDLINQITKR